MMPVPSEVMEILDSYARELDKLSGDLAGVERSLEPVEVAYEAFLDDFEVGCWERHTGDEEAKLPSAEMRLRLARKAMDTELLGRYASLTASRKRIEKRISALGKAVSAQQSILSALKIELESIR